MKLAKRIGLIWGGALLLAVALLAILPHRELKLAESTIETITLLIGIVAFYIFLREPNSKNKPIFLNFAISFGIWATYFLSTFVGKLFFTNQPFASFYSYQYFTAAVYFLISFSIVYVVFDSLFHDFKTYKKYVLTFLVVGGTFAYYFNPFFENPKYLYSTPDIVDFRAIRASVAQLRESGKQDITPKDVAAITNLAAWNRGEQVGTLYDDQKVRRVIELSSYLEGENSVVLLFKPLYLNVIYMNVLSLVFVFLFFGYQYKNDPPQGAYIEKIIFLFLPFCSLEILHHFSYIKSVEWGTLVDLHRIGQYLTFVNLLILLVFFGLRLRFITSIKGEFYERELVSDPEHISRWRDAFDSLVVRHFLDPKALHGRLLTPRTPGGKT